jgi:hypothetical protein
MKTKWATCAILMIIFGLVINSNSAAVNTSHIDKVRNKSVLDDQDKTIIDEFLAEAIRELVITRDFTSIAKTRTVILSKQKSSQGQYTTWYSELVRKHIQEGFRQAQTITPQERQDKVMVNLLILIDGLQDLQLADLAISMLKNQNMVIRYWAVHCLTNPAIIQKLNSSTTPGSVSARTVVEQLSELIESSTSEILVQIAQFAATVNIPQGEELLGRIADEQIERYANWTVKHELYDITFLKLLTSKIPSVSTEPGMPTTTTTNSKPALARRFAQLYSYVLQRYVKGNEILNSTQKQHLASVLVETEEKCISKLLGRSQLTIRRALERENIETLMDEHNKLLGTETTPGQLPSALRFNYNTTITGTIRTAPLPLPDPPQKSTPDDN